jgi:protein-disulfide isomerase
MTKRQEIREKRRRQRRNRQLGMIALITVGALLVTAALIYPSFRPVGAVVVPEPFPRPMAVDNTMGDPNAPVKIVEYSDFQCSFCARFSETTEKQIVEAYVQTGKVHFTYRSMGNFLSDSIARSSGVPNTESRDAIEAAYCAGDQGRFWDYKDILFANYQGIGDYAARRLVAYAEALDLDVSAFRSCLEGGTYRQRAEQDAIDGNAAGVTGTPAFVISYVVNGQTVQKLIVGAQPFGVFQQEIEAALAASASTE